MLNYAGVSPKRSPFGWLDYTPLIEAKHDIILFEYFKNILKKIDRD